MSKAPIRSKRPAARRLVASRSRQHLSRSPPCSRTMLGHDGDRSRARQKRRRYLMQLTTACRVLRRCPMPKVLQAATLPPEVLLRACRAMTHTNPHQHWMRPHQRRPRHTGTARRTRCSSTGRPSSRPPRTRALTRVWPSCWLRLVQRAPTHVGRCRARSSRNTNPGKVIHNRRRLKLTVSHR